MHFQAYLITAFLAATSTLAAPAGNNKLPRQTYIGTVEFISVDGASVKSNMQVGAGYRQLTQPGESAVMSQLVGTSGNLVCSSQSNDGVTTTVVGNTTASDITPPKQQVLVKCDWITGPPA